MSSFKPNLLASAIALTLLPGLLQAAVIEEITVTAQKREQNIQDVGIAMSAFSGEQMEQLGFSNAQQVTSMAPGVSTVQPNGEANYALAIRGVASSDFTTNVESPVAMYLDEVYISQMSGAGFMLFDMDRVEILRGPQGTLFGRNATGGLANFISEKPSEEFSGYIKGTIGDYDQYKVEGAVGGGVTDTLALRFSGSYHENEGYINNRYTGEKLNNADDSAYRLQALWSPTEDLSILLNARHGEQDIDTGFFENVTSLIPGKLTPSRYNPILNGYRDHDGNVWAGDYDRTGFNELKTTGFTGTIKWAFKGMNLTSITDSSTVSRHYIEDSDASPIAFFSYFLNTSADQFSQELRLDGETEKMQWVVGAYYLKLDITDNNGAITDPFVGPAVTPGAQAGILNPYYSNLDSTSVFGQTEYTLTDTLALIVGARYIEDQKDFKYSDKIVEFLDPNARDFDAASNVTNRVTNGTYKGDRDDGEWSGRLQLNWTPTDDLLVYTSLNRGVRGGGVNAPIFPLSPPLGYDDETMSYDPEQLDALEVGFKSTVFDGRARINGAAYYYDYKDYQAFYILGIDTITFNTDATSTGGELELVTSPIDGLDLLAGLSYNDINVELATGDVPSVQSPKWTFNALARYEWPVLNGKLAVQGDILYRDEHFFALTHLETVRENGYWLSNASVSYTHGDGDWVATAFVDNLTNVEYIVQTFDLSGPNVFDMTEQYWNKPRWWGVSLRYNWGA